MSIESEITICNKTLSRLGNTGTINNIRVEDLVDRSFTSKEAVFALWYDYTRRYCFRMLVPSFAMTRRKVSQKVTTPVFGYAFAYEYPSDAVRVLGFGDVDAKSLDYNVELGEDESKEIQTNEDFGEGMDLRFIRDVTNTCLFTEEFTNVFIDVLAANTALPITQDRRLAAAIRQSLPASMSEASGVMAQENPPTRKSVSKFKRSRVANLVRNNQKL